MITIYDDNNDYFEKLYDKYHQTVYKYILISLECNESLAEDCIQDVYTTAYSKIDTIMEHPNPGGFLIVTARNFIKKYKSAMIHTAKHTTPLDQTSTDRLPYEENFEAFLDENIDIAKLKQGFLHMLSDRDLSLYKMFYEKKYSVSKIAKLLSISEGNVKVRLYRLRLTVKRLVKDAFKERA